MLLEKLYRNKEIILKKSQEFFQNSSSLVPKIGCELEFFLLADGVPASPKAVDDFILELKAEKERGASQIEIKTDFTSDLVKLCDELTEKKNFIKNLAAKKNLCASFAAQPFKDDCGNALQFNVSLHDENDKNIFLVDKKILTNSASSLLQSTDEIMIFLAPQAEDYQRFSFDLNYELFRKGKFSAPVNLSFGADNRTCAIRIPQSSARLEYRIAAASADPFLSIAAILLALSLPANEGLKQIFGNAFDQQYCLQSFCKSYEEAEKKFFSEKNFVREKFENFISQSSYPSH
ncbi:MAG: hypothetical protein A2887_00900 [Alphaproteobacteria bacterium RIFCSPLOWO2_01_FULL_40_26]|nr:MAG: hypothetical protein A3D15_04605 [Alphaproteobacteria bacterium RIFCSPHIGHO2_02_FULL_40_34]OFW86485.1 MAG: hypothetical protein A2794_04795 [Alphaproteobacteria bacterium RIFCSPHIGHO2_01_FULL_40_8]OFW95457.1 MAG: hypothetical protein A2887_00900 [Alphaproteobacteria bacterium RIFCSPLOWO2_01_FULL_40_26]OFX10262.1 MAG: hypothetical protein A3H30_00880 [Alphaproteobacteria bacterium RIFCSPLOWO2_02_FULL_40_19]OFX11515.1 MAG: hypothetical protein A3G22_04760 [Alphaproteobacteria bacterium RI